ncbi:TonB-dependent siderophore receptor [Belnapia rosea]|uniref:Iron complex outermembrane recepter protein n=1 Tax=Belnapia rosea TaxID=938405 RepID=A0A1G6R2W4_9PROT|nr:TonB-dependent siderophore receptor [Belnapia rosea]SDC98395.1 iron complex outermembrane recepter protein [Belnapia rosea]
MRPIPTMRASALLAAALLALPAVAQEAAVQLPILDVEGSGETARGPVPGYVARRSATGTKTDTPLVETPQSISVITRDQLETQNVRTIVEALRYSPGGFSSSFDTRGEYFSVRGFTADIYLDGLRVPTVAPAYGFRIEPWGMERVELLRGTSSALYGQANLGGIVNAISKVPQPDQVNQVAFQGGSFNRLQGAFDVGGRLNEDGSLLWRLNGLVRDSDTFVDGGRDNRIYLAPSLTWRPSAQTSVTFLASYMRDDTGITGQWLPPQGTVLPNPNGRIRVGRATGEPDWDRYRKSQYGIGYILEHRPNEDWTLRQTMRATYQEIDYNTIYANGYSPATQQRVVQRVANTVRPIYYSFALDNQAERRFSTGPLEHTALAGLDLRLLHANTRSYLANARSLDVYAPVYGIGLPTLPRGATSATLTDQMQQQIGLYAQDQIRLDRWILTLTGRQDWADTGTSNQVTGRNSSQRDAAFTGRAALLYAFDSGVSPYVSYATSFLPAIGTYAPARGGGAFRPTTGEQVEAGVKYQPPGSNSLISGALFELTQQNVATTDTLNPTYSIQTGEVRVRGAELEARANLFPGFNLIAAFTVQDAEVTRSTTASLGRRPAAVPNHMASLWGDYTWRVTDDLSFGLGGGVRYIGNTLGNNTPSASAPIFHVPSYTLFDGMARADWKQWRLMVNAQNLGNERYVQACQGSCYYGSGRAVYATLAYRW